MHVSDLDIFSSLYHCKILFYFCRWHDKLQVHFVHRCRAFFMGIFHVLHFNHIANKYLISPRMCRKIKIFLDVEIWRCDKNGWEKFYVNLRQVYSCTLYTHPQHGYTQTYIFQMILWRHTASNNDSFWVLPSWVMNEFESYQVGYEWKRTWNIVNKQNSVDGNMCSVCITVCEEGFWDPGFSYCWAKFDHAITLMK